MLHGDDYFCFRDEILCLENILLHSSGDQIGGFVLVLKVAVQVVVSSMTQGGVRLK